MWKSYSCLLGSYASLQTTFALNGTMLSDPWILLVITVPSMLPGEKVLTFRALKG
jgi:hypothetical protein